MNPKEKALEEQKRMRRLDSAARWEQIYALLEWAEQNMKPEQNRNRPRYRDAEGRVHFY